MCTVEVRGGMRRCSQVYLRGHRRFVEVTTPREWRIDHAWAVNHHEVGRRRVAADLQLHVVHEWGAKLPQATEPHVRVAHERRA